MQTLSLDVAGEFLVMASTLIHIKSRMLLPAGDDGDDDEDEGLDPRDELVRRLLEYQRYKEAAAGSGPARDVDAAMCSSARLRPSKKPDRAVFARSRCSSCSARSSASSTACPKTLFTK